MAYTGSAAQKQAADESFLGKIYAAAVSGDPRGLAAIEMLPDRKLRKAKKRKTVNKSRGGVSGPAATEAGERAAYLQALRLAGSPLAHDLDVKYGGG
jgi:hypothetical protein